MHGQANQSGRAGSGRNGWPLISDRDAAAMRLALCRHLLDQIGEARPAQPRADFAEVGRYLSRWNETRVRQDPGGFCQDTARLLGVMLSHLEHDDQAPEIGPAATIMIG